MDHGWNLWVCWSVLAPIMLASKRYLKKGHLLGPMIHIVLGVYITIMTLVQGFRALDRVNWTLPTDLNFHFYFGIATMCLIIFLPISGFVPGLIGFKHNPKPWNRHKEVQTRISKAHRWLGYFTIAIGIAATTTGLARYQYLFVGNNP